MAETEKQAEKGILSSASSFMGKLLEIRYPYMFIQGKFKTFEIEENNPLKPYIDYYKKNADKELKSLNDGLEKEGSQLRVSKEDFDKALKYLAPERELKPGDSIQVTDGKITYEDLQEIAKDVKKVLGTVS